MAWIATSSRTSPPHLTAPGTFAKKDEMNSSSARIGMIIIPLMPWIANPTTSGNGLPWLSSTAWSNTPPIPTH